MSSVNKVDPENPFGQGFYGVKCRPSQGIFKIYPNNGGLRRMFIPLTRDIKTEGEHSRLAKNSRTSLGYTLNSEEIICSHYWYLN